MICIVSKNVDNALDLKCVTSRTAHTQKQRTPYATVYDYIAIKLINAEFEFLWHTTPGNALSILQRTDNFHWILNPFVAKTYLSGRRVGRIVIWSNLDYSRFNQKALGTVWLSVVDDHLLLPHKATDFYQLLRLHACVTQHFQLKSIWWQNTGPDLLWRRVWLGVCLKVLRELMV